MINIKLLSGNWYHSVNSNLTFLVREDGNFRSEKGHQQAYSSNYNRSTVIYLPDMKQYNKTIRFKKDII